MKPDPQTTDKLECENCEKRKKGEQDFCSLMMGEDACGGVPSKRTEPTEKPTPWEMQEELENKINQLWRKVKPTEDAQGIRARLSTAFDSSMVREDWLSSFVPDYLWDLIDVAAQWGIDHGKR